MTRLGTKLSYAAMLVGLTALIQAGSTPPANAQVACCLAGSDNCCDNINDAAKQMLSPVDRNRLETRISQIHKQKNQNTTTPNQNTTTQTK
jgi:hypothetical protein